MNPITIHNAIADLPEGVSLESRRMRITAIVGLAASLLIQLPGSSIEPNQRRAWFYENTEALRNVFFDINEAIPLDVDRAQEYAYRIFEARYLIAFEPSPVQLMRDKGLVAKVVEYVPEFDNLKIDEIAINRAVQLLKDCLNCQND